MDSGRWPGGHWWGVYAFILGPNVVLLMRYDVALQRASERDRAVERDKRIAELEDELRIEKQPRVVPFYNEYAGPMRIAGACTCVGIRSGDPHRYSCPQRSRKPGGE